jgi:hypothetical protein
VAAALDPRRWIHPRARWSWVGAGSCPARRPRPTPLATAAAGPRSQWIRPRRLRSSTCTDPCPLECNGGSKSAPETHPTWFQWPHGDSGKAPPQRYQTPGVHWCGGVLAGLGWHHNAAGQQIRGMVEARDGNSREKTRSWPYPFLSCCFIHRSQMTWSSRSWG